MVSVFPSLPDLYVASKQQLASSDRIHPGSIVVAGSSLDDLVLACAFSNPGLFIRHRFHTWEYSSLRSVLASSRALFFFQYKEQLATTDGRAYASRDLLHTTTGLDCCR